MQRIGRYEIEGRLGEGAMADVYRAVDPAIGRTVAVKVMKAEFRRDPSLGERFLREARAAGALNHANIATIYEVGEADGTPYIAMELVSGQPLDAVLETAGRMPYERVLALGAQLADALDYAHRAGIVHRDVKPSNILLSADGKSAKLLDFGVARIGEFDPVGNAHRLAQTQVGQMIGTPRYMSPEQALGLPAEPRSDLFSLGAVLYEMVTGKTAFAGPGLATLAIQIAQEPVAPIERTAADCPPGLRFIIGKLLAKKPESRFADAGQVAKALQRELSESTFEKPGTRRGLPLKLKLPLALVTVTAVALGASVYTVLDRQEAALERMTIVSGGTVASFVTNNAAVHVADNAGLPVAEQDWGPLQAFVTAAANDPEVKAITIADAGGTVRAASDAARVGRRYAAPRGEKVYDGGGDATATAVAGADGGIRLRRPIRYAGADFGQVDMVISRAPLDAALVASRNLLIALSAIVMLAVLIVGYLSGALVARPLARLRRTLDDAIAARLALRISHRRRDEIGAVFDGFNRLAAAIEPQLTRDPAHDEAAAKATRITNASLAPRMAA